MMRQFAVWGPRVDRCRVQVGDTAHAMRPEERGWWRAEVEDAGHGTEYGFLVDEDPKLYPDPRSMWQPSGVHRASRVLDHERFEWSDAGWSPVPLSRAIVYELHVGTFTPEGTFEAAAGKLAALRELGVTHVELMPVNSFPGRWGWGYDGVSLYAPQEHYGGPEGLKRFVNACHGVGMAVLLDVVYNHFGPDGNYTGKFGPYITKNHYTPWGGAVNFEESGSDEVRRFFCDNALMWLRDYHFDGLRLDAIHAFVDRSAKHFLEQLSEEVEALAQETGRSLVLIAESDLNDPRVVTPRRGEEDAESDECGGYGGGFGIGAQWSDDFHHALFALLTGERRSYYADFGSLAQVSKALTEVYVYDGIYSEYRERVHGRPVQGLSAHRFLGYIQNHDQVGNRAFGSRVHVEAGMRKAKLAAAMVMTAPFVPMIFQGEEFAASSPFLYFADHEDEELARAVSQGRRREHAADGIWDAIPDPEAQATFDRSKLNWEELGEPEQAEMLEWYRSLVSLRMSQPSLLDGEMAHVEVTFDDAQGWLCMKRGPVKMLYNFSDEAVSMAVPANGWVLLTSEPALPTKDSAISVPPFGFVALNVGWLAGHGEAGYRASSAYSGHD
jgi:maltooligosyltrehalose trehalohydrolase